MISLSLFWDEDVRLVTVYIRIKTTDLSLDYGIPLRDSLSAPKTIRVHPGPVGPYDTVTLPQGSYSHPTPPAHRVAVMTSIIYVGTDEKELVLVFGLKTIF